MRIKLITLVFISFSVVSMAQFTTFSPYSSYGIGEKQGLEDPTFSGLGNASITYFDSTVLNHYNPASYNTLGKGLPLFSFGITSRLSQVENSSSSQFRGSAYLTNFAMAFTLKERFGFAFGLKPFSRRGYEISERVAAGTDSIKYNYIGSGGMHRLFLGVSPFLFKLKNTRFSVGANASYIFGNMTNERRSQLIAANTAPGGVDWSLLKARSFHYELGAYFTQSIGKKNTFKLAAVLEPSQDLHVEKDTYLFYGILGDPEIYDTLYSSLGTKGAVRLPNMLNLGFNYQFGFKDARKNNSQRNSELSLHVNYSTTEWTQYASTFENNSGMFDTENLSVGLQYTPEVQFLDNTVNSGFAERLRYRAGYYSYTLPYSINGIQPIDRGFSLGFGMPITAFRTLSSINFSLSGGQRSSGDSGYNERYLGVNFGIVVAPANNVDRWFVKRKLD